MSQINQSKSDVMSAQEIVIFAVIAKSQSSKFVNPSETALTAKTTLIDCRIKEAFTPTLHPFLIAFVRTELNEGMFLQNHADF